MAGNIDQCKGRCLPLWTSFMVTLSVLTEISSQSVQFTSQSNIFLLFHRISEGIFLEKAQVIFTRLVLPRKTWLRSFDLASLSKWLSVRFRTKWFWVRFQLQSLKLQTLYLLRARGSLTFRQL